MAMMKYFTYLVGVVKKNRMAKIFVDHVMDFEKRIDDAIVLFSESLPDGCLVLDAGAGESRHRHCFSRHYYFGVDLAVGDEGWDYRGLDVVGDIAAMPFAAASFDAAISIVTMEHVCDPSRVLSEMAGAMKPGAKLLLVAPMEWEEHQQPHDYFRYTQFGLVYLLNGSGFDVVSIVPAGGIFRVLSRRCFMALKAAWWLAPLLVPLGFLFPLFDRFDRVKNSTLGYICIANRKGDAT